MKKTTMLALAGGTLAAALLVGWAFAPRPVEVEAATVTQGRFEVTVEEDGRTRLQDRYVVSAPLAGLLDRIALREGDAVAANDVVATLTPVLSPMLDERTLREQQLRVEIAQANVARVAARVEGARVALQQAANAAARSEQLARQGFVSETRLDSERLAVQAAQKDLEAAVQERHVAGHEVEQARAALLAVQRRPGAGRAFELRAPVAGRVLRVLQTSEAAVALGAPLLELGDTARLEVVAELLTADALQARPGSPVRIDRWGGPGTLQGRVRLVEPGAFTKVSALGVEEQRVRVLIDITSPVEQWGALGDAYRVGVRIVTQAADGVLKLPVGAVFPQRDGGMAVFVADGGRARLQAVDVEARNGSEAWVRAGVAAGTEVIVYPPPNVRDGERIRVRKV